MQHLTKQPRNDLPRYIRGVTIIAWLFRLHVGLYEGMGGSKWGVSRRLVVVGGLVELPTNLTNLPLTGLMLVLVGRFAKT